MSHKTDLQQMTVADLARRCADETEHYFHNQTHDTQYCFELFRRAIHEDDQYAWEMIFNHYQSLVSGWVKHHSGFVSSGEEISFFVTGAFAKISNILTSEKFDKFSDLQSLLGYLKMCVHSVITDYKRKADRARVQVSLDEIKFDVRSPDPSPESTVFEEFDSRTLWTHLNGKLNDEKERLVMQGIFVLALKPRELCDYYEGLFENVEEVYRIKQNIFARLRRDEEIRKFLGEDD